MVIVICLSVLAAVSALLLVRRIVVHGTVSESMCRELVAQLARSENGRVSMIAAYIDADEELEHLRGQKLRAWDVPDGMDGSTEEGK